MIDSTLSRCSWCGTDPLYVDYHDKEWGVPVFDDRTLFEFLILEGAQAGLSWFTILKKRDGYRQAFFDFEIERVSRLTESEQASLRSYDGIVRNRLKIASTVSNAQAFLQIQKSNGSFCNYIWDFVDGSPIQNRRQSLAEIPVATPLAETISKDLKRRGFRFVGPTIVYAYMQAIGMVNDHFTDCFRYTGIADLNASAPC